MQKVGNNTYVLVDAAAMPARFLKASKTRGGVLAASSGEIPPLLVLISAISFFASSREVGILASS